jgi:hypothetical protein
MTLDQVVSARWTLSFLAGQATDPRDAVALAAAICKARESAPYRGSGEI